MDILKYFWEKIILTLPLCFFTIMQSQVDILYGIIFIVIIDTFLGMWVAMKYKVFSSHHMGRFANKVGTYGVAMGSVWIIAALEPVLFGWVFRWVGLFIIMTEIFSNFEKLALLGFKIPGKLLSKLNSQFLHFINMEDDEKDAKGIDILKNRKDRE